MSRNRNLFHPGRSTVHATRAMAATSHPLATATALDILRRGGNAVDAGIAACAVLAVVEPQMTGIGGDCFALLAKGGREPVIAYNGSGRAPAAATVERLAGLGIRAIDGLGAHAVTVPGAVEAWHRLATDHGRLPFRDLLKDAVDLASDGHPLHERVTFDLAMHLEKVRGATGFAELILDGGEPPAPGRLYRNEALGRTLARIAEEGPSAFYTGPVAERLVAFLAERGGLHAAGDFASHAGEYATPMSADYRGHRIYQCPPNGQGVITLLLLRLLSHLPVDDDGPLGPWRLHSLMEAARIAFSVRDAWLADPVQEGVPWERFLDDAYTRSAAARIERGRVLDLPRHVDLPQHKDTVYLTVVDGERNAFSLINSIFEPFGSGLYEPETGILLHNRGKSFRVDPAHPNRIAPGKRPMHTIIPGMAMKDGRLSFSYGVMGGHFQPVGHAALLSNILDFDMDLQTAVDAPRLFPQDGKVMVEPTIPPALREALAAAGHAVELRREPIGGAQIIAADPDTGVLSAASDPRKDGCAIGY